MSKLYRQPVEVQLTQQGQPLAFQWRGRWYNVTHCTRKEENLQWWEKFRVSFPALRYQCETRQGLSCVLVNDGIKWMLERVFD